MAYEYLNVGSVRVTQNSYLLPTTSGYAFRIFSIIAAGATPNSQIVLSRKTNATTTETDVTTALITVPLINSGTSMTGIWDNYYGILEDTGDVLINSASGMTYAQITYQVIKK